MARAIPDAVGDSGGRPLERRVAQATARAFAAAISTLLVTTLVIDRSDAALVVEGTGSASLVTSGVIELSDDDNGEALFSLEDMAPGRPVEQCITVTYDGSILPATIGFKARGQGDLGPYLLIDIEQGEGARFGDCSNFVPDDQIFDGNLEELNNATADERLGVTTILEVGQTTSYRFVFELADEQEALGRSTSAAFLWEVEPG